MAKLRFFSLRSFAGSVKFGVLAWVLVVAGFQAKAQEHPHATTAEATEKPYSEEIMAHISDAYSWHFYTTPGGEHVAMPLPLILFEPGVGLSIFSSAAFHHAGETTLLVSHTKDGQKVTEEVPAILRNGRKYAMVEGDGGFGAKIYGNDGNIIAADFSITKNVASMLLSAALLVVIFLSVASAYKKRGNKAPKGLQNVMEVFVVFVRDELAKNNIGPKYARFVPFLLTIFFFIWINNLLGLLPTGANLSGNIAFTLTLAVITFVVTNINGSKYYWKHVFNTPGVPLALKIIPIIPLIEFIGLFTKPIALMIRLFANITAGHIVILSFVGLIFLMKAVAVSPVSIAFGLFISVLELFVAILQAYIFTFLSALFIGTAVATHHDDH